MINKVNPNSSKSFLTEKGVNLMGFFRSEKGTIISEMFKLVDGHVNMPPNWVYDILLYDNHLHIKQKVGGKAEATLQYHQITDVFYGTQIEIKEKKQSPIGRALVGGFLFGGAGAIVGAMTAGKKEKKKARIYLIISYVSSTGKESYLTFEDTRLYKGKKLANQLKDLCHIESETKSEVNQKIEL